MQFSTIKSKVYALTKTNSTSFPVADLVIAANNAMERVASLIRTADGRWEWDDLNQTDQPTATTALVASQQDYAFTVAMLSVNHVEVKDANGNWYRLKPIDQADYSGSLSNEFATTGNPVYYDVLANSVFLYPSPSYSQAASLKIFYSRPPVAFTTADTTVEPGFNSLYHELIPLHVAYDYAMENSLPNTALIEAKITKLESQLVKDYARKLRDDRPQITMSRINFR